MSSVLNRGEPPAEEGGGGDPVSLLGAGPHFMPDATYGVVRATGADDLERAGVQIVMTNAFHLMLRPGMSTLRALGGAKAFLGWKGPLATDSGGFQAYSLIRENRKYGRIDDRGLTFLPAGNRDKLLLGPEKAIQNQLRLGSDILFCLDDCTHPDDSAGEQEKSVRRTIAWARACKVAFTKALAQSKQLKQAKPLLFGVLQGGRDPSLRRICAEALVEIGFDGFGYGGWPIDDQGNLMRDMLQLSRELVPPQFAMHALGVGHPGSVVTCARLGYKFFDSALPTRDARRGRLYCFTRESPELGSELKDWMDFLYIQDERHIKDSRPLSEFCTGPCCARYSRGYLQHLNRIEDVLYPRLATIHNLLFMRRLTELLGLEDEAQHKHQ
jgi:queuine tRNA-ribosyltransferase